MRRSPFYPHNHRRRGAVAIYTAVSSVLLLGIAALAIDYGYICVVRSQLQTVADSAALAGAVKLIDPAGVAGNKTEGELATDAMFEAMEYSAMNEADNTNIEMAATDIAVGCIDDPGNLNESVTEGGLPQNAIAVVARKTDGVNGPVSLFFARIWGKDSTTVTASATAYIDKQMAAYRPLERPDPSPLIPIAVRKQKWQDEIVDGTGDDEWTYDPDTGEIYPGPDGVPEISIYPEKKKDIEDNPDGAGNFGMLNVNTGNNSASTLAYQIANGLSVADVIAQFGSEEIRFHTPAGAPIEHILTGNPGLTVSTKDDLSQRLGETIGFFTHEQIGMTGNNAEFTITGMQFGRIMMVQLTQAPKQKMLVIQPTVYMGEEIITEEGYGEHNTAARVRLVR